MTILTCDFGSTFTKLSVIDADEGRVLATSKAFTTIETDIREGYEAALNGIYQLHGRVGFDEKLACSSAGGGLKMMAVGLVPELTAKAARMAASSAGAKVVKTYSYELGRDEQMEINDAKPDIVLLSGGTDGGNKEVIMANAARLAAIETAFPVIVAGNKSCAEEVRVILEKGGKTAIITKNVMPRFNQLDIMPAKQAIRELFIHKIIEAKGLSKAQEMMSAEIIPTPLAVLEGCELLAGGTEKTPGIGEFMAVDVGGATTDVYSMAKGQAATPDTLEKGLPEPFAKRSVEGDLGLRYSMPSLVESATMERAASEIGVSEDCLREWVRLCRAEPGRIAQPDTPEKLMDEGLARLAVELAATRHAGTLESYFTPMGESFLQTGKDLRGIKRCIGIGGPIINSGDPIKVLSGALYSRRDPMSLRPASPEFYLDKRYIFASMGLVARKRPELALKIMKEEIIKIQ